jgi:hypothetical protein
MTQEQLDHARLASFIADGRLIRGQWTGKDSDGRKTACLLAALYPPAGEHQTADVCPAAVMRPWLAHLTPWIDDSGTAEKWPEQIRRYAAVISNVVALDADADRRLQRRVGIVIVREAMAAVTVDKWGVKAAGEGMIAALEKGDEKEIAAYAAYAAAAYAASSAATATAYAAYAAYAAAAYAASSAATAAAATYATATAYAAAAAATATYATAADRIIDGILTEMERAAGLTQGDAT